MIKIIRVPNTAIKTISPVTTVSPLNPPAPPPPPPRCVCSLLLCSCDGWCLRWKPHCCCVCCCPWNTWAHCVSPWAFCHAWLHTPPTTRWMWATWLLCWHPTSCTSTGTWWQPGSLYFSNLSCFVPESKCWNWTWWAGFWMQDAVSYLKKNIALVLWALHQLLQFVLQWKIKTQVCFAYVPIDTPCIDYSPSLTPFISPTGGYLLATPASLLCTHGKQTVICQFSRLCSMQQSWKDKSAVN